MSVARLNSLLHRPGTMGIVLQEFLIVIGLDDKRLHQTQPLDQHFGRVTEISHKSETGRATMERKPDRISGIMRHRKCLDGNVADGKISAGSKQTPVPVFA